MNEKYNEHILVGQMPVLFTILVQNLLISIKSGLDRLAAVLSFYYSDLQFYSTFGRIDDNGKTKGIMSIAVKNKDKDELCAFIFDQYHHWIKDVVDSRDSVIHYNDMEIESKYSYDQREFFMHRDRIIFSDNDFTDEELIENYSNGHYYKSLRTTTEEFYELYDNVFKILMKREINYKTKHFKKKSKIEKKF
jgi:hypothetical protein